MNSFINIPEKFLDKWQEIANLLAKIIHVPAALIMKTENEFMEVFISNKSENNPYKPGDKEHWAGLYCETVIKSQHKLHVPNALKDKDWDKNPDIKLGMIAYLGLPLNFPDKTPFGTICVLDEKENKFTDEQEQLLHQFKNIIELDLALIQTLNIKESGNVIDELQQQKQELTTNKEEYEAINEELRQTNDELLQTKQIAEESEEKFRTIFNMSLSFICIADINTATFKFINPTFSRILGYSEEELLSKPFLKFIHPDDVKPTNEVIEKQLQAGNTVVSFENRYLCKNGVYCWLSWNAYPVREKGITYSIAHDITDRKKTEQEILNAKERAENNEDKFKKLFNNVTSAIFIYDPKTYEIIEANEATSKLYGYSLRELAGMSCLKLSAEEDKSKTVKKIAYEKGAHYVNFRHHKKKDGTSVFIQLFNHKLPLEDKEYMFAVCDDITEKIKSEQAMQQINKRQQVLLELHEMTDDDIQDIYNFSLEKAVEVTESKIGFLGFVNADESMVKIHAWSASVMNDCEVKNLSLDFDVEKAGIWGEVIRQRKPFLINDFKADNPLKRGVPKGHVEIEKYLSIPIFDGGKIVAVIAVGNKDVDYNVIDMHELTLLLKGIWNIVQRKLNAEKTATAERKLKETFNLSPAIIAKANLSEGRFVEANKAVTRILGYSVDEFTSKPIMEMIHPDDRQRTDYEIAAQMKDHETIFFENRYRCKNGSFKWIAWHGTNADEKELVTAIGSDITERKNAELLIKEKNEEFEAANEELQQTNEELIEAKAIAEENENKVRGMFRNTEMGLIFCNAEGQILEINKAIIDILGSPSIEATKQINLLTFKPLIDAGFSGKLQQSINERITISGELKYKSKWGLMVFMHYQLIPLVVHDKLIGVWINLNNLTDLWNSKQELIKAKEQAEESEAKLLDAQQLTHVGHWEHFIDSDTVIWSKELFNIFERPYDLSAPKYAEQRPYYKKESFAILDKAVQDCLQYGTPYEIELDIITSKGSIKHIISKGRLKKDANNRILSVYGTAQDITPQKKLELQLIDAKEKAEEANRLKTEFLNNMSHEIRTPMNGIIGFSEMLNNPNISKEKRKHYSKIVQNGSHQLLRIIDDILAISTLETKQEELNETAFCLNDLLMELFSIFNLKSKEKNIPLYLEKALHDDQSHIISDKTKLNKILGNLLENALKFTNKGFIEFGYYVEKANLILYVKDTGIGISPKNHHIIFERFSQEDKEISLNHGGLGLGLSICKENAKLLGGDITLKSEKGKGSTFYVTIPYKPVQIESEREDVSMGSSENSMLKQNNTVLVAEDEEVNYLYIEALFEDEIDGDYNLIHAKDGQEAVEICASNNNIDLVLMDIKMPIINGHEATEKIKEKFPDLPVIAQTAYSTDSDKQLALKHGCDDFISKPIDKEKLVGLINKYLNIK